MRHAAHTEEMENAYKILIGKSDTKKSLGKARCKSENNTNTLLKEGGVAQNSVH
jgi:hypothetical protein